MVSQIIYLEKRIYSKIITIKMFKFIIKKIHLAIFRLISIFLPYLRFLRFQSLLINQLNTIRLKSNDSQNLNRLISKLNLKRKIVLLDVGAQDFEFDELFPKKYENYFEPILVEPNPPEAAKLKKKFKVIQSGLWSSKTTKELYITGKNPGGTSMYKPYKDGFDLFHPDDNFFSQFDITKKIRVKCDTISNNLKKVKVKNLDYLKIHAQGAEFEILKGLGNYKPIMMNLEVQLFPQYQKVPNWTEMMSWIYKKGYMISSWKKVGGSIAQYPVQMNMIFIPNFSNPLGRKIINQNKDMFVALMLFAGQIKLIQILSKKINFKKLKNDIRQLKDYYFY